MPSSKRGKLTVFSNCNGDALLPLTSEAKRADNRTSCRPPTCALGIRINQMRPSSQADAPLLSSLLPHRPVLETAWSAARRDDSHFPGESETMVMGRPKSSLRHPETYQTWLEYTQNLLARDEKAFRSSRMGTSISHGMLKEVHSSLKRLRRLCFLNEGDDKKFKWCYVRRKQELIELSKQIEPRHDVHGLHRLSRESYQSEAHEMMLKRIILKFNPKVRRAASKFWMLMKSSSKNLLYKKEYIDFNAKAFYALLPFFDKQYAIRAVELDWLVDVEGKKDCFFLTEEQFYNSMFELVDNWCEVQEVEAFTLWLNKLWVVLVDNNTQLVESSQIIHDERYWLSITNPFVPHESIASSFHDFSKRQNEIAMARPELPEEMLFGPKTNIQLPRTWAAEIKLLKEKTERHLKISVFPANAQTEIPAKATVGQILSELHPKSLKPQENRFSQLRSAAFARLNTPDDLKLLYSRVQRSITANRSSHEPNLNVTVFSHISIGTSDFAKFNTLQECRVAKSSEASRPPQSAGKEPIQAFTQFFPEDETSAGKMRPISHASSKSKSSDKQTTSNTPLPRSSSSRKTPMKEERAEEVKEAGATKADVSQSNKSLLSPWFDSGEPIEFSGFPSLEKNGGPEHPLSVSKGSPRGSSKRRRGPASYNAANARRATEAKSLWNEGDGAADFLALSDSSSDEN